MKIIINKIKLFLPIILLIVWIIFWINFNMRDLFKRGLIKDYRALISKNYEGKISYTYGDDFFELLKFVKKNMPKNSTYKFIGIEEGSLESRRGIYYLYPLLQSKTPDYIIVYKERTQVPGYRVFKKLDNNRFILKRY
jgi:hypothetical protein